MIIRCRRPGAVALAFVACLAAAGCGRVSVAESYQLDIAILDPDFRQVETRTVGVRTKPAADTLDLTDLELVARDGTAFKPVTPATGSGGKPTSFPIGKHPWVLFAVPGKHVDDGGMQLRVKSSGKTVPLPEKIEKRKCSQIEADK